MGNLAKAVLSMAAAISPLASASPSVINLDLPGVLEALERDNPGHYRRVADVLRTADELPCLGGTFLPVQK